MGADPFQSLPADAFGVDADQSDARKLERYARLGRAADGSFEWECFGTDAAGIPIHQVTDATPLRGLVQRPGYNSRVEFDTDEKVPLDKGWLFSGNDQAAYADTVDHHRYAYWGVELGKINRLQLGKLAVGGQSAPAGRTWVGGAWMIRNPQGDPVDITTYGGTCPTNRGTGQVEWPVTADELQHGIHHVLAAYISNAMSGPGRYGVSPAGKCDDLTGRPPPEQGVAGGRLFTRPATPTEIFLHAATLPAAMRLPFTNAATALATYGARVFAFGPKAGIPFACNVAKNLLYGWIRPGTLLMHRPCVSLMPDGSRVTRFVGQSHALECVPQ